MNMSMGMRLTAGSLVLLLAPLLADEVRLKDGGALKGEVIEDTPQGITLKSAYGTVQIARSRIASVQRGAYSPPPAPSGAAPPPPPGAAPGTLPGAPADLPARLRAAMSAFGSFDYTEEAAAAARSLVEAGPPAVRPIADALPDATPTQQKWLAEVLAEIRDPAGGKAVLDLVHSPKGEVRVAAAQTLAILKHPQAAQILMNLLNDGDWNVRLAAARGLSVIKPMDAVPALIERLSDASSLVRGAAHDALSAITEADLPSRPEDWKAWLAEHPVGKDRVDLNGRPVPPKRREEESP